MPELFEVGVPRLVDEIQRSVRDAVGQQRCVGRRGETIGLSVHDQGGCLDVRKTIPGVVTPAGDAVPPPGVGGHIRIAEEPTGGRPFRCVHEIEQCGFDRLGIGGGQSLVDGLVRSDAVRTSGRGAAQDQVADALGMADRDPLCGPSSHRRAVDIGAIDPEVIEDADDVIGEPLGAEGLIGFVAVPSASVVEGEGAAGRMEVRTNRIPPVVVVRLPGEQDQWGALALDLVGDPRTVGSCRVRHQTSAPGTGSTTPMIMFSPLRATAWNCRCGPDRPR